MKRFACIHFPNWPIQRLIQARPELRRQRVALFEDKANRGQLVVAASPLALQAGVRVGMPLAEAKSLLGRSSQSLGSPQSPRRSSQSSRSTQSPPAVPRKTTAPVSTAATAEATASSFFVFPYAPAADRESLTELARQMHDFSPSTGVEQTEPPECLLMELTGVAHLFGDLPGSEHNLLDQILAFLDRHGFLARAAAADTLGQAWALACFGEHPSPQPSPPRNLGEREQNHEKLKEHDCSNSYGAPNPKQHSPPPPGESRTHDANREGASTTPEQCGARWTHPRNHRPLRQILAGNKSQAPSTKHTTARHWVAPCNAAPSGPHDGSSEWKWLDPLPPAALRLDHATCQTLTQLGIESIAQLRKLPRPSLAARFGNHIAERLDQASGAIAEVLPAIADAQTFSASQIFDFPLSNVRTVQVVIERLLEKICREMQTAQQGALQWQIELGRQKRIEADGSSNSIRTDPHPADSPQVLSTQCPVPSTQHLVPSTPYPVLSTQYPVPSTQNALCAGLLTPHARYSVPSTQYSVPSTPPFANQIHSPPSSGKSRAHDACGKGAKEARSPSPRLTVNLFQPTAAPKHVMQLVAMQLEQQRDLDFDFNFETSPIEEITVRAAACVLLAERQSQIFDDEPRMDRQSLSQLLNRLAIRLGAERIVRPVIVAGAQPEFAYRYDVLVGNPSLSLPKKSAAPSRKLAINAQSGDTQSDSLSRPLRLQQPAQPLSVVAAEDGPPPALLVTSRWRFQTARHWGPERIETSWWRGDTIRRDYWRVESAEGQMLWIYRDLENGNWFLQGTF